LDKTNRSGGVMILIKENIKFEQSDIFDIFNLQIIAVKILVNQTTHFYFITIYLPPQAQIPEDSFFRTLSSIKHFILAGDLNSKSKAWYCIHENPNGNLLKTALEKSPNIAIVKNKTPTHFSTFRTYDILDMFLASSNLIGNISNTKVLKHELSSDHFPMITILKNIKIPRKNKTYNFINFEDLHKTMEKNFKTFFTSSHAKINYPTGTLDSILRKNYEISLRDSSKEITKKTDNINLPKKVMLLIKEKKEARKQAAKYNSQFFTAKLNLIAKILKKEILDFKSASNTRRLDELAKCKASDSKFWKLLNNLENSQVNRKLSFPYLAVSGKKVFDPQGIAQAFGANLSKIFVPYKDDIFDNEFEASVNAFCSPYSSLFRYDDNPRHDAPFSSLELENALNQIRVKSAPGPDGINNKILKNLQLHGKKFLLFILNKSFIENDIPENWKKAKITMIPKKSNDPHNINNYRPISLTNSLVKLLERLIKNRLSEFLESNKLLSTYQSGFRANRCAMDNIFYFTQKCMMGFADDKKTGGIVFDIEKAFDKIWHEGLLIKLHNMKVPNTIANWIKNFLTDRTFFVSVNGSNSDLFPIKTGVPQGSILSPMLFSIFIDDIPLSLPNYPKLSGVLYADDLFTFYTDKNIKRVQIVLQMYLNRLQEWLERWRLKVAPHKCSYNIYSKSNRAVKLINIKIFGQAIGREVNPRYLGVLLDPRLTYETHINTMRDKCFRKMNFLRVMKHKKILNKTRVCVYNAMIRSNIDFAAPVLGRINNSNQKRLKSIQYNSLRIMLNRKKLRQSHSEMIKVSGIKPIFTHLKGLRESYIEKALKNIPMIKQLKNEVDTFLKDNPGVKPDKVSLFV